MKGKRHLSTNLRDTLSGPTTRTLRCISLPIFSLFPPNALPPSFLNQANQRENDTNQDMQLGLGSMQRTRAESVPAFFELFLPLPGFTDDSSPMSQSSSAESVGGDVDVESKNGSKTQDEERDERTCVIFPKP